jgi:type IV pilus assembly protein PilC
MSNYIYVAVDPAGRERRGMLEVPDQGEALRRVREMGLFPTKLLEEREPKRRLAARPRPGAKGAAISISIPGLGGRVKPAKLATFTRQLATLVEAGMPLLRSLRILEEQEESRTLQRVIGEVALGVENGNSLAEAIAQHPRIFSRLYFNMVKAGEVSGALEVTLIRLAEFMEKARKLKGKIVDALFYPCAVLMVAAGVLALLMVFIVPQFRLVFQDLLGGRQMPAFTVFVLGISDAIKNHILLVGLGAGGLGILFLLGLRTAWGRRAFDRFKLDVPIVGPLFRKAAISRLSRTLGTLVSSGVPILQALTIVRETAGNVAVRDVVSNVHDRVKEGDPIAPALKASPIFPAMVAGMVDVGEQTGALPEMLMKIADNYDDEVDNAATALTSVLEPVMVVFLAVVVGSIVIAMFLPLIHIYTGGAVPEDGNRMD